MILGLSCLLFLSPAFCVEPLIVGYIENWGPMTSWWSNYIPGNCLMGCEKPAQFMPAIANYSQTSYGFTFLTTHPDPDQVDCSRSSGGSGCPVWNGKGVYMADSYKQGSTVVSVGNTGDPIAKSPGLVTIGESCRLGRQGPYELPKRCHIALGGWSDWARIGTSDNAKKIAKLASDMVAYSFADGIDLDFEHLTPFAGYAEEFVFFAEMVLNIRKNFDNDVVPNWHKRAQDRYNWLNRTYAHLENWEKKQSYYYPTNMQYMKDLLKNDVPKLTITWTTRFNAFVPPNDPYNYLKPSSPVPGSNFETDNEGTYFWPEIQDVVDYVNIMAYDAGTEVGPLVLDFDVIMENFVNLGDVPREKIIMGFEPGSQAAGGVWEGLSEDLEIATHIKQSGYGGAMVWAINNGDSTPLDVKLATGLASILGVNYPFTPVPQFSKCNPRTGWIP